MAAARQSPVADVAARLHAAAIRLLRRVRREDAALGLPPGQASALSVLVFGGGAALGELARIEQVQAPTMTRMIDALERRGLVRRQADADDRRRTRILATPAGARIMHAGRERRVRALAASLDGLTKADMATLAAATAILERLLAGPERGDAEARARKERRRRVVPAAASLASRVPASRREQSD